MFVKIKDIVSESFFVGKYNPAQGFSLLTFALCLLTFDLPLRLHRAASLRLGYENNCAEGTFECGSSSYRLPLSVHTAYAQGLWR